MASIHRRTVRWTTQDGRQRTGEAFGVDGGLHHAGRHVGPGDEGGVTRQSHAPKADAGRFKLEDWLQDDLCCGVHERRKLRSEQRGRVLPDRRIIQVLGTYFF